MGKPIHISKSDATKFSDLEAHIVFLDSALRKMSKDYIWYKVVAAELRVLIGDTKHANRLLPYCLERFKYRATLGPSEGMAFNIITAEGIERWDRERMPFDLWCEKAHAISLGDRHFSIADFARAVAQQEGSAHEGNAHWYLPRRCISS